MPTGYTHAVKDGISFRTFALGCARAFGALVSLRDEPAGPEAIPEAFAPAPYCEKRLIETEAEVQRLAAMSPTRAELEAAHEWETKEAQRLKGLADRDALSAQYRAMLANVEAWEPPSPEHAELKTFMREQLKTSIDFDCGGSYWDKPTVRHTGETWLKKAKADAERAYLQAMDSYTKDLATVAKRNVWLRQLRESLPMEPGTKVTT